MARGRPRKDGTRRRRAARPGGRAPIRRILHATDFSRPSRQALALAEALARALDAELILAHAYEQVVPVGGGMPPIAVPPRIIETLWEETRRTATRRLDAVARSVRRGNLPVSVRLVRGVPARAIVRLARQARADLLVLGTHGRTGIQRLLLGSVAERVVRTAPCPVLTVGPRPPRGGAR